MPSQKVVFDLKDLKDYKEIKGTHSPSVNIPESEKTPRWFYEHLRFGLKYYNTPATRIAFDTATTNIGSRNAATPGIPLVSDTGSPVDTMLRMISYYLGKQPNLDYAWMTPNASSNNLQVSWVRGNDVSEYIHHFRGLMIPRLSRAEFTGKPINKEAVTARSLMYDKLKLKQALAPMMKKVEEQSGMSFNPLQGSDEMEFPEDVQRTLETNFNEQGAETCTDLANGIYYTNAWFEKLLQDFFYMTVTGLCALEHCVEDGMTRQYVVPPYQVGLDNRIDNDFGRYDMFRFKVEALSPTEIFSQHPELSEKQREEIEEAACNESIARDYNAGFDNMNWCNYGSGSNTVTRVTYYFKAPRKKGRALTTKYGNKVLRKVKDDDEGYATVTDIYKVVVIMNRFLTYYDLDDNVVLDFDNTPMFPIQTFRPNTIGGESVSDVKRVANIQDELDMLNYKIREMVGQAKGKKHVFNGGKFGEALPQEVVESLQACDIFITVPTGEVDDPSNSERMVEVVDMTLDPNIYRIVELYKERKAEMSRVMSVTDASLGQQTQYIGLGVQQNAIAQSSTGLAYTIDMFMNFVQRNMAIATNMQKNLPIKEDSEIPFMVGREGVKYIKLTKGFRFQQFMIMLTVNSSLNEEAKARLNTLGLAWAQNSVIDPLTALKLENANSSTKAIDILEFAKKEQEQKQQKQSAAQQQAEQAMEQQRIAADQDKTGLIEANKLTIAENNNEVKLILGDLSHQMKLVTQYIQLQQQQEADKAAQAHERDIQQNDLAAQAQQQPDVATQQEQPVS